MAYSRYLSARQAAEYLGVTYRGFDQFVRRHGVPHLRYGAHRRFTAHALDRVLQPVVRRPATKKR